MKIINKIKVFSAFAGVSLAAFGGFAATAYASVPSLSISSANSNQVQITVSNADFNAPIYLYYYQNNYGSATSVGTIGSANSSGYFTTTISQNGYNIPSGANAYVLVDGQQSNSVAWPYGFNNGGSSVTLSQQNITVSQNQSATVSVYGGSGSYYISNNSNSGAVSATVNGSVITLYGNNYGGSSTLTVCSNNSSYGCATLYVTVNGNGNSNNYYGGSITFSQPNVTVNQGTIQYVNILQNGSNYSGGSYYVSSNSNPNVVSAITGGNLVSLSGLSSGSATITVCSQNGGNYNYGYNNSGACGTLYVTVNSNYQYPSYNPGYPYYTQPSGSVYLSHVPYTGANDWAVEIFLGAVGAVSAYGAYRIMRKEKVA